MSSGTRPEKGAKIAHPKKLSLFIHTVFYDLSAKLFKSNA